MRNREITKEWLLAHGGIANEIVCEICGDKFLDGVNYHPGHMLHGYNIYCCKSCYECNWDGWAPQYETRIFNLLKKKGIIPPPRNEKGWLPREF